MLIFGLIIALGAAFAFAAIAGLIIWGGLMAIRGEVQRDFVSSPSTPVGRILTIVGLALPMVGASLLAFLAAGRILQMVISGGA